MDRARLADAAIAAGVAGVLVGTAWSEGTTGVAGYVLPAVGGLALAARRRAPVAVLAVTGLCAVGAQAAGSDLPAVAFVIAVYGGFRAGHRLTTAAAGLAVLVLLPLATLAAGGTGVGEAFARARGVLELAWLIAAGAAGEALRQAERRADEAVRTREETARRRAGEERLHLARELHDSLTHQISVIKVQAEAAVHVAGRRGEPVPEVLLVIRDAGRAAARDLRATLEALRGDDRNPPPGLADLPGLVERARTGGLEATLTMTGTPADLPAAVERTAYRIVQEALTNVARHAAAATATVRIDHRPGAVAIRVDDDGTAPPGGVAAPGVGLLGMRERVTALGGRLHAGPRPGGGFSVRADLPVDGAP